MSEINYNSIPVPPYSISEFIEKKTKDFIISYIIPRQYHVPYLDDMNYFIDALNSDTDKVQSLSILINDATVRFDIHKNGDEVSKKPPCRIEHCQTEENLKALLYYYYGKISRYGFSPFIDTISPEETYSNNKKLDALNESLDRVLGGQEIIFDEVDKLRIEILKQKIENSKGLQILGKQNFITYVLGLSTELMTVAAISNVYDSAIAPHINSILEITQKVIGK